MRTLFEIFLNIFWNKYLMFDDSDRLLSVFKSKYSVGQINRLLIYIIWQISRCIQAMALRAGQINTLTLDTAQKCV